MRNVCVRVYGMVEVAPQKLAAHRPSRRLAILDAAVRVFAKRGFADTTVNDVAMEAGVVPNAIYYHFAGKEELLDAALGHAMLSLDEAIATAWANASSGNANAVKALTDAVWHLLEDRPDESRLLFDHRPGATPRARALWEEFEARHLRQALNYLDGVRGSRAGYSAAANNAAQIFTGRTLIALLIALQPLRLPGGILAGYSQRALRKAVYDVAASIISPDRL